MAPAQPKKPATRLFAQRTEHRRNGLIAYAAAAATGVAIVARIFPPGALDGTLSLTHPVVLDTAQHIAGQRWFLADAWRWPPLLTRLIDAPGGVNIALTDSIPLAALVAKPFAALLPRGGHLVYGFVALCYALQPLAAAFAVRSAGVRGWAAPVAAGVLAVCLPAFLFRFNHAALCGHFTLLLAAGVYFRMVAAPASRWWLAASALLVAALLVHPYLMAMDAGIALAAPLTLLARRQAGAAAGLAVRLFAGLLVLAGVAWGGGYLGADTPTGFGYYSLNLLSPFVPSGSSLIGGFVQPDATGGQYEGYSYLGLGVLGLLVLAVVQLRRPAERTWLAGHAGLVAVALGALAFAASDKAYAGSRLLFENPFIPGALRQFRASGRFVWVDLYLLVVVATALVARGLGSRRAALALTALACLQYVDTRGLRGQVAGQLRTDAPWALDPALYRPLLASHQLLTIWPTAACDPGLVADAPFMHLLLLASEAAIPVNTIPTARTTGSGGCSAAGLSRPDLLPGELRVLLPGSSPNLVASLPGLRERCHGLPAGVLACAAEGLDAFPLVGPAPFPLDQALSLGQPDGAQLRGVGWTDASADGAWTIGPDATLLGAVPATPAALRLRMVGHGLARAGLAQTVRVRANGREIATWQVAQGADATYEADIPAGAASDGGMVIALTIGEPVRPSEVLGNGDPRPLGFFLRSFRLDAS